MRSVGLVDHIRSATLRGHRRLDKQRGDATLGWLGAVAIVAGVLILVMG